MDQRQDDFTVWWTRHHQALLRIAIRWCKDVDTAKDIVQAAAILCWERPEDWPLNDDSVQRMAGAIRWRAFSMFRREGRRRHLLARWLPWSVEPSSEEASEDAPLPTEWQHVEHALEQLPPRQRAVIRADLRGERTDVIAHRLKISPATVRSLRRHAIMTLRDELSELASNT